MGIAPFTCIRYTFRGGVYIVFFSENQGDMGGNHNRVREKYGKGIYSFVGIFFGLPHFEGTARGSI